MEVLAPHDKFTAWIPVPERGSLAGEFVALLTIETLPVTLPAAVGAKVTLKLAFCPAGKVKGRDRPLTLKPVPVTLICEIVTPALPVL